MTIKQYIWATSILLLTAFLITSCGSDENPTDSQKVEESDQEVMEDIDSVSEEEEYEINFVMPSPLQIAAIFKRAGLPYSNQVTNSPDNTSKYSDRLTKALNFGVYAADLSYCVLNKQSQDAIKYMKSVKTLSDDLGMTAMFGSSDMFESFEKNLENEDSLIYILATIQENLDEHLESNEQQYMSVIFFAGGWAEGMYIGTQVSEKNSPTIASRLIEQMVILENMIQAMEMYPHENSFLNELIVDFKDIDNTYRNFDELKGKDMDDVAFDELKISVEELDLVIEKIEALRTKIVNG